MSTKEPLQKGIIIYLAQTKPQTINETARRISKDYKSSWIAFQKLQEKNLIKEVDKKYYRHNEYPLFWLTEIGILHALNEGAYPKHLLNQTLTIYPQNRNLQFFIETVPIFGKGITHEFGTDILGNPEKVEANLIACLVGNLINTINLEPKKKAQEQIIKFKALLKKYPEFHQHLPNKLKQDAKELEKLANLLQQERSGEQLEDDA
jgi:hypothetical protein